MHSRVDKLKAMQLTKLGLSKFACRNLAHEVCGSRGNDVDEGHASKLVLKDVMDYWDERAARRAHGGAVKYGSDGHRIMKKFMTRLVELGMTREDWLHLPQESLKGWRKKEDWLDKPLVLLGTLTRQAILYMRLERMTVKELLAYSPDRDHEKRFYQSLAKTRKKLRRLGFKYEDGVFLQAFTKRRLVEDVMQKCRLHKKQATLVVESARNMGWGFDEPLITWERDE